MTVARLWRDRARATPSAVGFLYRAGKGAAGNDADGGWVPLTWRQADERVRRIAGGLLALGVEKGARIAILCRTRVEWVLVEHAILCAGAAVSTIYPSSLPDDCLHVLKDAGCWAVFAEDPDQLAKITGAGGWQGHRVLIEGEAPGATTLLELEERGARWLDDHPTAVDDRIDTLGPEDLATLIYTSGTTGRPKGVVLVHDNWTYQAEIARATLGPEVLPGDLQYLFLPLAHSFGLACIVGAVDLGVPTALESDLEAILPGLMHTRPTTMPAVPRVFEKIHARIVGRAQQAGPRRYAVFRWAVGVGDEVVRREQSGQPIPLGLRLRHAVADRLVFGKLRAALGGRVRMFASGGAPLAEEIARFFRAAGLTIVEGYGLTETSAGAVANTPRDFRFGTVGKPVPGCELRIAEDGEILLRGRNVMRGYWNNPEATAAVLEPDGWLHTGDLGRLDPEGRLVVTGRKKDLIITSGGKNIAPADLENRIKASCPLVSEIVMVGDRRPYCVALVWLDPEAAADAAAELGLAGRELPALAEAQGIRDRVWAAVEQANATVPSYATIKRIHVVPEVLSPSGGLLTPSLKVKRNVVADRYAAVLDQLYAGAAAAMA